MNIKNIVNRDIVNLTNCEHEPIHIPGSIQPHGFLLGLNNDSLLIDFCSANSAEFIKLAPEALLGKDLAAFLSKEAFSTFRSYINTDTFDSSKPFVFTL
jgi:chemotaxis family two-component system sensor kinase Cph1